MTDEETITDEFDPENMERQEDTGPHGFGLEPSPPSMTDFDAVAAMEGITGQEASSIVVPDTYKAPHIGPVLDQGITPQCVAFSASTIKQQQDRPEGGKFFDFAEGKFFSNIGGGPGGAVLRNSMDELVNDGYPVVHLGQPGQHKIAAYFSVPRNRDAIKKAIFTLGPIMLGFHWYNSWMRPFTNGVLPPPDWYSNNHAIVGYGFTPSYLRLRQSWSARWGIDGDCLIPWWMVESEAVFEIWAPKDKAEGKGEWAGRVQVAGPGINIREPDKTIWARAKYDGYTYRTSDGKQLWSNRYAYEWNGGREGDFLVIRTKAGKYLRLHKDKARITVWPAK